ncbi:VCBS repeat domain-containing M23 family metallopeptidase [Nonomuraea wenchangensis]
MFRSTPMRAAITTSLIAAFGLVAAATPAMAAPNLQLPFPCGQQWRLDTWAHAPALDMVKEPDQQGTNGALLVAPAAGTVNQSFYHDNAGNVIQIDHGGGYFTTYLHLQSRSVSVGAKVQMGSSIGRVGATGPTSNGHPHLHFELGYDADGNGSATWGYAGSERVRPTFNGVTYGSANGQTWRNVTSNNCGQGSSATDFSGDGKADVIARNATTKDLHLYLGNGSGGFKSGTGDAIGNNWGAFDVIFSPGDFNGDGKADVIARNSTTKDLHLYLGNGSGGFKSGTGDAIGNNWGAFDTIFSPGDFNGDGKADVIARNSTTKDLHLYLGNGSGGFKSGTGDAIGNNWGAFDTIFSPGDFNGDGKADVIVRNSTTKDLHLYLGNGSGGFKSGTGDAIGNNWGAFDTIFSPGDFSGDGKADVIVRNSTTKDLHLYLGNGSGGFKSGTGDAIGNNWGAFDTIF